MSEWSGRHCLASRPSGPDTRIKAAVGAWGTVDQSAFVARPTTDMTTQVRDRIAAFQRDVTVAETLREMLARIPATSGEPS